jgi:hypothetical protein
MGRDVERGMGREMGRFMGNDVEKDPAGGRVASTPAS